ncbi:MAG TPA: hypothetical protein VLX44_06735 [Xanthobacteraceae bacterium]|nr:hypothetical protein [Xanthobacteraceae bacterium]
MTDRDTPTSNFARLPIVQPALAAALALAALTHGAARADDDGAFRPGNLLVSRSVYQDPGTLTAGTTQLPPNCVPANCVTANASGAYPTVFNNDIVDASFGITSKIFLDELTRSGDFVRSLEVPNSMQRHVGPSADQMVTSFSSKSELALNLSTDKRVVSFMGYLAPVGAVDVSNTNTPFVVDATNLVPGTAYRVAATVDTRGHFSFTKTDAYSGNNGRAAILNDSGPTSFFYLAGNAGNGSDPQPAGVIEGAGAQFLGQAHLPLGAQLDPGTPTPLASFNVTQLGDAADKVGKDTNFRGLTVFNNVVYYTKGSGGNGVNTVYFVDTSGHDSTAKMNPLACPAGVGLPSASATLPAAPLVYDAGQVPTKGVFPYNMCILNGFPTALKSKTAFPFGLWFANATTVYVADEGNGTTTFDAASNTYKAAAAQTTAGLQKWVFDTTNKVWKLVYTLSAGLDLGAPYTVAGYPTGNNPATGLPWSPATDGLRNLTGHVNRDGTVTIWAITSTVSGNGDTGADPNKLVKITDTLAAAVLPAGERFATIRTARLAEVLRGVSFTPGTGVPPDRDADHDDHDRDRHDHDGHDGDGHDRDGR